MLDMVVCQNIVCKRTQLLLQSEPKNLGLSW